MSDLVLDDEILTCQTQYTPAEGWHTWFLKIAFVHKVGMHVCPHACISIPKVIIN